MAQLYMMSCVIKVGQQLMEGECIRFYLDTHGSLPMKQTTMIKLKYDKKKMWCLTQIILV